MSSKSKLLRQILKEAEQTNPGVHPPLGEFEETMNYSDTLLCTVLTTRKTLETIEVPGYVFQMPADQLARYFRKRGIAQLVAAKAKNV